MRAYLTVAVNGAVITSEDLFDKAWEGMARFLSDHACGLVDMSERDRTVLCNSALNAALRYGGGVEAAAAGRTMGRFVQMREYMRAHSVTHDAVAYTLLVRVAKQELAEAVRETQRLVASRTRQGQSSRAEEAAAATAAAVVERRGALALRNLLNLWVELGAADTRVQAAGEQSILDSRLVNGLLAALGAAGRLIEADPLALTVTLLDAAAAAATAATAAVTAATAAVTAAAAAATAAAAAATAAAEASSVPTGPSAAADRCSSCAGC